MLHHNEVMRKWREFMEERDIRRMEEELRALSANPMGQKIITLVRDIVQQHGFTEQVATWKGQRKEPRNYVDACTSLENCFKSMIQHERKRTQ